MYKRVLVEVNNSINGDIICYKEHCTIKVEIPLYISPDVAHLGYEKRLLLRCVHHFKSDSINNLDDVRISGTEPSSVILNQTNWFKSWRDALKIPIQAKAKEDYLKRYQSTEVHRRTWLHVPSVTPWSTSSDTHQVVEIYINLTRI